MADELEALHERIGILTREVDFWRATCKLANARADSTAAELKSTEEENDTLYSILDACAARYGKLLRALEIPVVGNGPPEKDVERAKHIYDEYVFWHAKAGEEHARCIQLERELQALKEKP